MKRVPQEMMEPIEQASGFPSPATEYKALPLDLNLLIVEHPAATSIIQFHGHHGEAYNIHDGDRLVLDKSLHPHPGQLVLIERGGERFIKQFYPARPGQAGEEAVRLIGVLTWVLKNIWPETVTLGSNLLICLVILFS